MDKETILEAIESGNYEATFEPVNSIYEYTKYDGTKFYVLEELDDEMASNEMGTFTVNVHTDEEDHEFVYDMGSGDWEGDDLCTDSDVIDALESIESFISYDDYDGDLQWEVYANVNHIPLETPYYFQENEDYPKDIEELGDECVEVPLRYTLHADQNASSKPYDMECTLSDQDLYDLYKLVKDQVDAITEDDDEDEEQFLELADEAVKKAYPDLYEAILQEIEEEAESEGYDDEDIQPHFTVCLSKQLFEENL